MNLPINFLLHVTSTGLLGLAGWTFYQTLPEGTGKAREQSHTQGVQVAKDLLAKGKGDGPVTTTWNYNAESWKVRWMAPNLLGKDPPKDPGTAEVKKEVPETPPDDQRPLEQIIELVSLVCESDSKGAGGLSHVIVRYRDGVDVQPPLWYVRENSPTPGGSSPGDAVAAPAAPLPGKVAPRYPNVNNGGLARPGRGGPAVQRPGATSTPMPVSSAGQEILQTLWVKGDGSPHNEATLWPPFDNIRLVRVASDAKSAIFVRTHPPRKGEPPAEPKEEELLKSTLPLSQEVLKAVTEVLRNEAAERLRAEQTAAAGSTPASAGSRWVDVEETTKIDNVYQLGRKENPDDLVGQVNADTYVSHTGSGLRGVRFLNVDPGAASRFGVAQGDVLLEVNGEPVHTKAEAINVGRRQYERGQRTFVLKFLSNGQVVERTYQAPDRR